MSWSENPFIYMPASLAWSGDGDENGGGGDAGGHDDGVAMMMGWP